MSQETQVASGSATQFVAKSEPDQKLNASPRSFSGARIISDGLIPMRIRVSPELFVAMEQMALDIGESKSVVFVRAMALFQMAVNARIEGKRIYIIDDEADEEREITGFGLLDDDVEASTAPNSD